LLQHTAYNRKTSQSATELKQAAETVRRPLFAWYWATYTADQ